MTVEDAKVAFDAAIANGGVSVQPPTTLTDAATGSQQVVAEVNLYGDVVMRFISGSFQVTTPAKNASIGCGVLASAPTTIGGVDPSSLTSVHKELS